jgi:hypothetical protein
MTTNTGKHHPTAALRVKLTEVLTIAEDLAMVFEGLSQADASKEANLCYPEGTLPVGEEFVCTFTGEYAPEHQVTHLELPSSLIDKVDDIALELVLHGFIVCLDTGRRPPTWRAKCRSMMTLPLAPLLEQPVVVRCWRGYVSHHYGHDQGWSTTYGGWRYTVAASPHVMPALMVIVALGRRVPPLLATVALLCACALGKRDP